MSDQIAVSAWGIRHALGSIYLPVRRPDGRIEEVQVTQGEPLIALADVPAHLKATFGARAIEIPDFYLLRASPAERAAFAQALVDEGVTLRNVTVDGRFVGDGVAAFREDDLQVIEEVLAMSAGLGAKAARVNLLQPPIVPGAVAASFDEIVSALKRLAVVADRLGLQLLIENHCDLTDTVEKLDHLMAAVGPALGFILDTGNIEPIQGELLKAYFNKSAPGDLADAEAAYETIAQMLPRAAVVHVKTYGFHHDGRSKLYDLDRVIDLVAAKHRGPFTIECAIFQPEGVYDAIETTVAKLSKALTVSA